MKGKDLLILLLLAAVAGGALYLLSVRGHASWSESAGGGGKILDFPINDVAHLRIKNSAGELHLRKKGEGWAVQERADYPASFKAVGEFVRRLWELRTGQEVKVGPSQMPRLELVEPGKGDKTGTVVEVGGADGKVFAALLIGKKYGSKSTNGTAMDLLDAPKGRYVQALNGTRISLVADSLDDANPNPAPWLLKDFVHVTAAKAITVVGRTDAGSWTVTRENPNAEWKVAGASPEEQPDSTKTYRLNRVFSNPTFTDVLAPNADLAASGLDKPTVARIDTFDSFHYEFTIGTATGENFPLLVSVTAELPKERIAGKNETPEEKTKRDDEFKSQQKQFAEKLAREQKFASRAFLVPKLEVEPLLKNRGELLADKPAAPSSRPGGSQVPPASTE
ncbi:MAG TPA: DUF4340 domain-containing protein [Chthoniobacter sp.]|jgi:hypothetical protein